MVILITGLPGTGKTEVANELIKLLSQGNHDVRHYNSDFIRYKIYPEIKDDPAQMDRDFTPEELTRTYNWMYLLFEEVLKTNTDVIIVTDGTYRQESQRNSVKQIAINSSHQFFMVKTHVDEETILHRSAERFKKAEGSGTEGYYQTRDQYEDLGDDEYYLLDNSKEVNDLKAKIKEFVRYALTENS